ncbi:hypothetical protein HGP17_25515 [Rhizobium sp. P38BS-XIX]|uniref:hypothetical protein n=1 Tax=Rhizobium sp. P38BS-XIX TaxID=2726740 RepID=UPI001457411B|nr:hypothetical protein [Rhizobium sp. P38BS-XIX]NLS00198.1 hypothetical protein [Rhizobium sp. P38BS-XIX]
MRIASFAAIAALSLAGMSLTSCGTLDKLPSKIDQANGKIQSGLAEYCPKVANADLAFSFLKIVFKIPQSVVDAEEKAFKAAQEFCADPSSVTLQSAPQKVLDALNAINSARTKAGGSN